jgi:hypothetical protein
MNEDYTKGFKKCGENLILLYRKDRQQYTEFCGE